MSSHLHPDLTPKERRELFRRGVELFNRGELFACHEAFEEIWRSTTPEPLDLFQGLIQVAVGFYHYSERQRPDVARRMLTKGRKRLERVATTPHGLDLAALLPRLRQWEVWLTEADGEPPPIPSIHIARPEEMR